MKKWGTHTAATRKRIAESRRGKAHSDETREKIRQAALARWARHRAKQAEEAQ